MFKKYVLKHAKIRQLIFENMYNSHILAYLRRLIIKISIIIKPRSPAITQRLLEHDLTRLNGLAIILTPKYDFFKARQIRRILKCEYVQPKYDSPKVKYAHTCSSLLLVFVLFRFLAFGTHFRGEFVKLTGVS